MTKDDSLKLTVVATGKTETGRGLFIGDAVRYVAHLPGGNVKVKFYDTGETDVANPNCFQELR